MFRLFDSAKAMLKHRCAEADCLNAERLTPPCGYASSKTDIILFGLFEIQGTSQSKFFTQGKI
jgi:hypothetical protein